MSSIDIAIPCFQYGRFLRDSVGSVLRQDVDRLRVLIIDNGSTDDSLDVAREIASEDKRVHIVAHERNVGPIASLNEGIDWATADYFIELDADDLLAPGCLKRAMAILDSDEEIAFCHGFEQCMRDDKIPNVTPEDQLDVDWRISSGLEFIQSLCAKGYNFVGYSTVVRRTKIQKSIGHFDPHLTYANDMNMWLRLATRGKVAQTSAVQGFRRLHPGQITQVYRDRIVMDLAGHLSNFHHFFEHEGARIPDARRERRRVTRRIAFNALYLAVGLILNRQLNPHYPNPRLGQRLKQSMECIFFSATTYADLLADSLLRSAGHQVQVPDLPTSTGVSRRSS